jgi:3-methyladenine DNA glycosylase AlkD
LTTATHLNLPAEVAAITDALAGRRDPGYEWGMRRTVPSQQAAHATRVPDVRAVVSVWRRAHRDVPADEVLALCEALWATGWREERIVAISLVAGSKPMLAAVQWDRIEAWSRDIDNWEHVDHLAGVTGRLLIANPSLLPRNEALASSDSPWQRRLALVTLIVAFMKSPQPRCEPWSAAKGEASGHARSAPPRDEIRAPLSTQGEGPGVGLAPPRPSTKPALIPISETPQRGAGLYRVPLASMADRLKNDKHPIVRRAVVWARDRLGKDDLDG